MSTYSLANSKSASQNFGSVPVLNASASGTPVLSQQPKLLDDALQVVKQQGFQMRKSIDANQLYDAFKYASTMLSELRTSSLLPKYYYELYMALFDELRYLTNYLYEIHVNGTHHLSNLYELVQYASHIVPRLYLMVTVGSVYMRISNEFAHGLDNSWKNNETKIAPVREIMMDMLEMSRGVQHATRGLFLRYYLSGLTRDYLPDVLEGSAGNINDSINFVLQNFVEMNKLWVRLQYQGHSKDKDRREQERRELRLLVGSNLVRLSQLEEISLEKYQNMILPNLLEEIVGCRDVIAQEYLFDVIIQAFPDEFHLHCLDMYLSAVASLESDVNVKNIVISLIDRFSGYAIRSRDEASTGKLMKINETSNLFDIFWEQIAELIAARSEFVLEDVIALFLSINGLALNCYPENLEYVDRVLGMTNLKVSEALAEDEKVLHFGHTKSFLKKLLLAPIETYQRDILTFLRFPSSKTSPIVAGHGKSETLGGHYTDLLFLQSFGTRREVAHTAAKCILRTFSEYDYKIDSIDGVNFILGEICSIMVRDQIDGNLFGSFRVFAVNEFKDESEGPLGWEDAIEEQTLLAKILHSFRSSKSNHSMTFSLQSTAIEHLKESGDIRIRYSIETIICSILKLAKELGESPKSDELYLIPKILKFALSSIEILGKSREQVSDDDNQSALFEDATSPTTVELTTKNNSSIHDSALNLYLLGAKIADLTNQEELCYEFMVGALSVYEESVSESRAQTKAITQLLSTLLHTTVFGFENFETLITKSTIHCSRLLKRADQSRAIMKASRLFWADKMIPRPEGKPAFRDPKKVLECLQKSLKIADSVMDRSTSVGLFVEILEQYLWFYENKAEVINASYINSLIEMIQTNLALPIEEAIREVSLGGPLGAPPRRKKKSKKIAECTVIHFLNILAYIRMKKVEGRISLTSTVPNLESGFQSGGGRWGDVSIPDE